MQCCKIWEQMAIVKEEETDLVVALDCDGNLAAFVDSVVDNLLVDMLAAAVDMLVGVVFGMLVVVGFDVLVGVAVDMLVGVAMVCWWVWLMVFWWVWLMCCSLLQPMVFPCICD